MCLVDDRTIDGCDIINQRIINHSGCYCTAYSVGYHILLYNILAVSTVTSS